MTDEDHGFYKPDSTPVAEAESRALKLTTDAYSLTITVIITRRHPNGTKHN